MKNATFRQLRVFSAVARHLSFARAAEELALTPPAVTQQIKELEGHVGFALFDRRGRKVALTGAGEYMLIYARRILATLKEAENIARQLTHAEAGTLEVAMVSGAKYVLMPLLADFLAAHPALDLKLHIGNREKIIRLLQDNEADVAVMGRVPEEHALIAQPFAAHPLAFVAAPGHRLTDSGQLRPEALRYADFIVREKGSGTRAAFERFFAGARIEPRIRLEVDSNESLKQAVMAGLGLGFVSMQAIGPELRERRIAQLDIEGAPVMRSWNVVHARSRLLSPAAEALRYMILEQGDAYFARGIA